MRFRLTPRSMTLELEFEFLENFSEFRRFRTQQQHKRMKIDQYCQRQRCKLVELEQFWHAFASHGFVSDSWAFLFSQSWIHCSSGLFGDEIWSRIPAAPRAPLAEYYPRSDPVPAMRFGVPLPLQHRQRRFLGVARGVPPPWPPLMKLVAR